MANKGNKYKCLTKMEKFEPSPHVIEDKEGVVGPPPNRYYKTPHGLLENPSLNLNLVILNLVTNLDIVIVLPLTIF